MTAKLSRATVLPRERPPIGSGRDPRDHPEGFDWEGLVPRFIHPLKVAIIEALHWIGEPLSATELRTIFGPDNPGSVTYHLDTLAKAGVLEITDVRRVRGARESYYFFASPGS